MRFGSFFTGGGGADIGAKMAGAEPIFGYEYIPKIAAWAEGQLNHPVKVQDILSLDPSDIPYADILHFSPECKSSSRANPNAGENENDILIARKICAIIEEKRPQILTLENVWQYRFTKSYKMIASTLNEVYGFSWDVKHVNFADYGVPQTRQRMIVRTLKGKILPAWPKKEKWIGWYEAVEDIIDTFPEGKLANWQLERLPEKIIDLLVIGNNSGANGRRWQEKEYPAWTLDTSGNGLKVIIDGVPAGKRPVTANEPNKPSMTITAGTGGRNYKLLMSGNNKTTRIGRRPTEPSQVNRATSSEVSRIIDENFRVLVVTTRGLARFMSFPDWYELPETKTLANTILGNAVPPVGYSKILKGLIEANQ